jgi:hypothetical protein
MSLPDFNIAKFNIPISIKRAFEKGKIADSYQQMYMVAEKLASLEAKRREAQTLAEHIDSRSGNVDSTAQSSILKAESQILDYKSERIDYHMKQMIQMLELNVRSHEAKHSSI